MRRRQATKKIDVGAVIGQRELLTISGERVRIPDADRRVHLQLRRFAGCPICSLHLRSVVQRHDDIEAAGIREVVVFHSPRAQLLSQPDLPFAVVADPDKDLYLEFAVEPSIRSLLDPRTWPALVWGALRKGRPPPFPLHNGPFGLPAEFLIASDGRVLARKYGVHADDQWSVDDLLHLARAEGTAG